MALRSHVAMPVGHFYWGVFAGVAQLPNVLGAPIQSAKVQIGDTAYDSVTESLQMCTTATVGAATWSDVQGVPDSLVLWRPTSVADFALFAQDAGAGTSISYGASTLSPYEPALLFSKPGATTPNTTTIWEPVGFTWPSTNRVRMICRLGPRATASPGLSPQVFLGCQATNRYISIARNAAATSEWFGLIRNQNATSTVYDSGTGLGAGQLVIDIAVRQPSPGVDPAFEMCVQGAGGNRVRINGLSTAWTGGSPPHSSGWNAAWQAGTTPLKLGWGTFEYTGAGSGFISSIGILKHPLDW